MPDHSGLRCGLALGGLGVLLFSVSLPATRAAVSGGIDPYFVGFGRAVVAGAAGDRLPAAHAARRGPSREQWRSVAICAAGVVVGFPVLTSLALETGTAVHAVVVIGILPAATAVVRRRARRASGPAPLFWARGGGGPRDRARVRRAARRHGDRRRRRDADRRRRAVRARLRGGRRARRAISAGRASICWALHPQPADQRRRERAGARARPAFPTPDAGALARASPTSSVFSMFLGFFAWYAGLARGGVARISQVQLLQPLLSLGWAALLLGEQRRRAGGRRRRWRSSPAVARHAAGPGRRAGRARSSSANRPGARPDPRRDARPTYTRSDVQVLTPRQELILRKVVEAAPGDRPARRLEDAERGPRARLRPFDDPQRAGDPRGAGAARAPAHLGRPRADRRRPALLRRPPAARPAPRRAELDLPLVRREVDEAMRVTTRDARAGHEPAGDRLRAAARDGDDPPRRGAAAAAAGR